MLPTQFCSTIKIDDSQSALHKKKIMVYQLVNHPQERQKSQSLNYNRVNVLFNDVLFSMNMDVDWLTKIKIKSR